MEGDEGDSSRAGIPFIPVRYLIHPVIRGSYRLRASISTAA
jgi:hypothetical protein